MNRSFIFVNRPLRYRRSAVARTMETNHSSPPCNFAADAVTTEVGETVAGVDRDALGVVGDGASDAVGKGTSDVGGSTSDAEDNTSDGDGNTSGVDGCTSGADDGASGVAVGD
jgi:hypothetical protein